MKKTLTLLSIILIIGLLCSEQKREKEMSSILDFGKINSKYHTKQFEVNDNYLESLEVVGLFEFVYELALFDTLNSDSNWMIIISPLQKKRKENDYSDLFIECLEYDFNNSTFKSFLLEIASNKIKEENCNFNILQDKLLNIAKNKKENIELRRSAILRLKSEEDKYQKALSELFVELLEDRLKGAVITRMRRNQHPELQDIVYPILVNHQDYKEEILHPAILASDNKSISILGKIARETLDPMTYRICLNKLGKQNTPETVIECFKSLDRFSEDEIVNRKLSSGNFFWYSQTSIEFMLKENETDEHKILALKVIRYAKMPFGDGIKRIIENIRTNTLNTELKKECQSTLNFLTEYRNNEKFDNAHKMFKTKYR